LTLLQYPSPSKKRGKCDYEGASPLFDSPSVSLSFKEEGEAYFGGAKPL